MRILKGLGLVWSLVVACVGLTGLYGLVLAFMANVWLGVLCLFVQPLPLIIGVANLTGHPEIIPNLINFIHKFINI